MQQTFYTLVALPCASDVNKDLTLKAKDKDQTLKAKDQDKDQTPKDKDKDQTFKAKDQDKDLVNYNQYRVKLEKILKNNAKMGLNV